MTHTNQLDGVEALIIRLLQARGRMSSAKMDLYRESKSKDDEMPERILVRLGLSTAQEIAEI
jgi:hypothetical protein